LQEQVKVGVSVGREPLENWRLITRAFLEPLKPLEIEEYPFGYDFHFNYYPEGIEKVRQQLDLQGISSTITVTRYYNKQELLAAEYLRLDFTGLVYSTKRQPLHRSAPRLVCRYCDFYEGTWNLQDAEIKEEAEGYKLAWLDWNVQVVSRNLADELRSAQLTGLVLVPVGRRESPDWYGLQSNHVLPPMQIPPTRLLFGLGRTSNCLANHRFDYRHSEFFYSREFFNALDINCTHELFGVATGASRSKVISNRVYQLLSKLGVASLKCEPIRFID
jgi:hypothetical protein